MRSTAWKHRASLSDFIADATEDASKVPTLLDAMATIVAPYDESFAEELREAAADAVDSRTATQDADFWLAQFYEWADAERVWIS